VIQTKVDGEAASQHAVQIVIHSIFSRRPPDDNLIGQAVLVPVTLARETGGDFPIFYTKPMPQQPAAGVSGLHG
jgi:hypothetical protein